MCFCEFLIISSYGFWDSISQHPYFSKWLSVLFRILFLSRMDSLDDSIPWYVFRMDSTSEHVKSVGNAFLLSPQKIICVSVWNFQILSYLELIKGQLHDEYNYQAK